MPEENKIILGLKALPIFSEMQDSDIANILSVSVLQFFPANYFVMRENEPGDFMCIIKKGQVEIFKGSDEIGQQKTELAVLADGEVFGEMALISNRPRNASAKTIDDAEIFILKKTDFDKFLQENSSLASKISHDIIERMKKNESTETV
ncbi:cyclic nucleotide-binding domain-containing protein [Candidatus Peregrinibacteria bacterium]|nr:cyclic nucleotide-binding domain-containing protein [Candidatus Peregrinibacteria bacterium]